MNWEHYQVGRRVVCITEFHGDWALVCSAMPAKGRIYTIRAVTLGENSAGETRVGLRFEEFEAHRLGAFAQSGDEWSFAATDFRPVDEARLEQFRQFLASAPKEGVRA
jgi:hypothetical protein